MYYSTILFFIITSLLYLTLFHDHPLWKFKDTILNDGLSEGIMVFISHPCAVLMYLPHYPKKIGAQIIYISFWALIYALIEFVSKTLGFMHYYNGWNYWFSVGFDFAIFTLLRLHFKKPLYGWIGSFVVLLIVKIIFKIPFKILK